MALNPIPTLIDKQDNFEIIRDQIGAILFLEVVSQMALADLAGKDPELWNLNVRTESVNPIEDYLNQVTVTTPIVNVWYQQSIVDPRSSNPTQKQKMDGTFNIDCYGFGVAKGDGGTGQLPGDQEAKLVLERALRLVRNILMAGTNIYLQLRGLVTGRMTTSIVSFQPGAVVDAIQEISAARIVLEVQFFELAPQVAEVTLEFLSVDIHRVENSGELLAEVDIDYTA